MVQANHRTRPGAAPPPKGRCGGFTLSKIPFFSVATSIIANNLSAPLPLSNADLSGKPACRLSKLPKLSKARPRLRFAPLPLTPSPPLLALLQPRRQTKGVQ